MVQQPELSNHIPSFAVRPMRSAKLRSATDRDIIAYPAGVALHDTGVLHRLQSAVSRDEFFAGLFILCCTNGLTARAVEAVELHGWSEALLSTFNVSMLVWIACFAGISLVLREKAGKVGPLDLMVGAATLIAVAIPFGALSWMALTGSAIYLIWSSESGSSRNRGAWILLATTAPMCWTRLLFALLAKPILEADAILVSLMVGTERVGNMVRFAGYADFFQIYPACSSLANVSLALLCWVMVTKLVGHEWRRKDILWCGLACASVVAVNVIRVGLIGLHRDYFVMLHGPVGTAVAGWITLGLIAGICALGVKRELLARA
jgi:exosortase/archaeosortase family protein